MAVQRKKTPRTYVKSRRAEQEAETRQRIVEAAVGLHGTVGPAQTTISMIAERAGVQRHTVYAHFPDERSLLMACSGLHLEREPLPLPGSWADLSGAEARLTAALTALYAWFARNEDMLAAVLRDAERHALLREISNMRFAVPLGGIAASVSQGLGARGRATLTLALDFHTWRTLTRRASLKPAEAVDLMVRAVTEAESSRRATNAGNTSGPRRPRRSSGAAVKAG